MKIFKVIALFEFKSIVTKKSWYITTLVVSLLIVLSFSVPTIIDLFNKNKDNADDKEKYRVYLYINTDQVDFAEFDKYSDLAIEQVNSESDFEEKLHNSGYKFGLKLKDINSYEIYYKDKSLDGHKNKKAVEDVLKSIKKQRYLEEKSIDTNEFLAIESAPILSKENVLGADATKNFFTTYLLLFIIYFLVIFYGQAVSASVAKEKNDRTMEILITSTSPNKLLFGKVIGCGASGLLQFAIFMVVGFVMYKINESNIPLELNNMVYFTPKLFIMFVLFIIFGYVLYLFIYAMLGATVSKLEDLGQAILPVTLIMVVSYFVTISAMQFPNSTVMRIASLIPFSSSLAMYTRISLTSVSALEVALSIVILVGTMILFGFIGAKIYRSATLNYGNRLKLKSLIGIVFNGDKK